MPNNLTRPEMASLLSAWGRRRLSARKIRSGVYRVKTPSGDYCLKSLPRRGTGPGFLVAAEKYLRYRNCFALVGLLPTVRGQYRVVREGHTWILTRWINGSEPRALSAEECRQTARALARFHRASGGFAWPGAEARPWTAWLEAEARDLTRYVKRSNGQKTVFDRILAGGGEWILSCCARALDLVLTPGAVRAVQSARQEGCLCHGDAGVGNYIIDTRGEWKVIDLETLCIDHPARDLYRLIRSIMKRTGWDVERARQVMAAYEGESPLTAVDWQLTLAWLIFPHKLWRVCRRRYDFGDNSGTLTRALQKALGAKPGVERLWNEFLPAGRLKIK